MTIEVVAKSFKMLGMIKKSFEKLDEETVPLLFKSVIRPILKYGNCVWGPMYSGDQDAVERVLRRATKLIVNTPSTIRRKAEEVGSHVHVLQAYQR